MCNFCQNYDISHEGLGKEVSNDELADMMIILQNQGYHNINFVTPSHVVPQILSALELAIENGLKIPEDLALVGFDDTELASCLTVPLTTVRSPIQGMGERAMECLAEKMSRGPLETRYQEKLPMNLIVRESTSSRT